jgi:dihydrofolate reductase
MKLIWNPAVTLDGNIAKADGDSDWPTETDGNLFEEQVRKCGCVIAGRKTFKQYQGEVFPIEGATTFVWTQHPETAEKREGVEYISGTPEEVVAEIEAKGFKECVLAGGTITNNAFVSANLVDEIIATIYPLLFGKGMPLLSAENCDIKLRLLETAEIGDGVVRNRYQVLKA